MDEYLWRKPPPPGLPPRRLRWEEEEEEAEVVRSRVMVGNEGEDEIDGLGR